MAAKIDYAAGLEKFVYINTPDEIFREAGRAIINLSNAELLLGGVFSVLCEPEVPTGKAHHRARRELRLVSCALCEVVRREEGQGASRV
jgi:hypothetical protein